MRTVVGFLKVFVAVLLIVLVVIAIRCFSLMEIEHLHELIKRIKSWHPYDELVYVFLTGIAPLALFPDTVLNIIGAEVYGPVLGALLCSAGAILGSIPGYFLGGFVGRGYVERTLGNHVEKFQGYVDRRAFVGILLLRVLPILPFGAVSYIAGLSKIPFGRYLLATALGTVPVTLFYQYTFATFGRALLSHSKHLGHFRTTNLIVGGIAILMVSGIVFWGLQRLKSFGSSQENGQ
ncbi:TVP38/TMEM64 family inner membrane protein YdjZ [Planctomycetes bacterium Pan216]|uniref:TVP38/TMEM64 family membrane protein n=2 Tax=Kolteria novifilia TaxID=2527975 RepID=A0A518B3I0_9BACT|nr:TVP38/TMEM64 family inner membrane protein YdjZ [Planctomycetes bacterium Pan216]